MREDFEKWYISKFLNIMGNAQAAVIELRNDFGGYDDPHMDGAWGAFKRQQMSASEEAKAVGFKSLAEVRGMLGSNAKGHPIIGKNVLHSWHKNKPELFRVVIAGCAAIKGNQNAN